MPKCFEPALEVLPAAQREVWPRLAPAPQFSVLVASLDDLLATKLKAILDRAESRDYRDIAAMLRHGMSLAAGLAAFQVMFGGEPAQALRAIGFFEDRDLASLSVADRRTLTTARDSVRTLPRVQHASRSLAIAVGDCDEIIPPSTPPPDQA